MLAHNTTKADVTAAYKAWRDKHPREAGVKRHEKFRRVVASTLRIMRSEATADCLPGSLSTWSDWGKLADAALTLPHDLCKALWSLSDVDVTADKAFSNTINMTDIVTLAGAPRARRVSNMPVDGREDYEITVPRIAFRQSDTIRVTKDWETDAAAGAKVDIGALTFWLREAQIIVDASGEITPIVHELDAGEETHDGATRKIAIADDPGNPGVWRTTSPATDASEAMLHGSVEFARLCTARAGAEEDMSIRVEAKDSALQTRFTPNEQKTATEKRASDIRSHLINQLLRDILREDGARLIYSKAVICRQT